MRGPYTPDEARVRGAYDLAAYQITEDYGKAHTAEETNAFNGLYGRYEMNPGFYGDWSKRLIGKQSAAAYKSAESELAARSCLRRSRPARTSCSAQQALKAESWFGIFAPT